MNVRKYIDEFFRGEKMWVLLDQALFSATSFFTTIILARTLGIEGFGHYSSIVLFLYLLLSVSNALIIGPFQVLVARENDRGHYMLHTLCLQLFLMLILILATILVYWMGLSKLSMMKGNLTGLILMLTGFLMQDFFRKIFIAIRQTKIAFITDAVSGLLQVSLLLFVTNSSKPLLSSVIIWIGWAYISAAFIALFFYPLSGFSTSSFKKYFRLHTVNGKWLILTSLLQWCSNNLLVAASGLFVGVKALGALRLAQTLFGVLNALLQVFENYALPKAAELFILGTGNMKRYLRDISGKSFLLLLPVIAIAMVFPKPIFRICGGEEFIEYAYALQGMAFLYLVIFIGYPLRIAIRVMLMNREFFVAYCVSFVFSVTASEYLISRFQLEGVIIALIINQLLMISYWQFTLYKKQVILWK
jgi:O-antigen/teichoic acid export membrane protein